MRSWLHEVIGGVLAVGVMTCVAAGDGQGQLIFKDDFQRTEADDTKEQIGNGWETNSASRAGGNKQADLRDGTLHMATHPTADHAVSVRHDAEFRNGSVQLRFLLEDPKDSLGLDFADLQCKSVHAGHLFKVTLSNTRLEIADTKTGAMNMEIYDRKKSGSMTAEDQELVKSTRRVFPVRLETGQWHTLDVKIQETTVEVQIDDRPVGSFSSEGFGHPTKRMLRFSVPREAVVDDVRIYSVADLPAPPAGT